MTVTVTDNDGGFDTATLTAIAQDAPRVDAGPDLTVYEGTPLTLVVGFIDSASETHDASIVWGDGTAVASASVNQSLDTATATHTFVQDGLYLVTASVTDDTNQTGTDTLTITVLNATPTIDGLSNVPAPDGIPFTVVLATFADPGTLDTHTAIIDWGDGTTSAGTVGENAHTVSGTHSFIELGSHAVTITLTDDSGASATVTATLLVFNPPPVPSISTVGLGATASILGIFFWRERWRRRVTWSR